MEGWLRTLDILRSRTRLPHYLSAPKPPTAVEDLMRHQLLLATSMATAGWIWLWRTRPARSAYSWVTVKELFSRSCLTVSQTVQLLWPLAISTATASLI